MFNKIFVILILPFKNCNFGFIFNFQLNGERFRDLYITYTNDGEGKSDMFKLEQQDKKKTEKNHSMVICQWDGKWVGQSQS